MSAIELRTLAAAQIAAAMMASMPTNTLDSRIREIAEVAVKAAQAVQDAAARSLAELL